MERYCASVEGMRRRVEGVVNGADRFSKSVNYVFRQCRTYVLAQHNYLFVAIHVHCLLFILSTAIPDINLGLLPLSILPLYFILPI